MLRLLSRVAADRLELGDNITNHEIGIAAFKDANSMQIFLFRQKMVNWELPEEMISLEVETDWNPGVIHVTKIDEKHCNPYKIWLEMGKPQDLTRKEVNQIKEQSMPIKELLPYKYEEGKVKIEAGLKVNDIWFIELDLQEKKKKGD